MPIRKTITALLFVTTSAFAVEEAELARGLINIAWMHNLAHRAEFRQAMGHAFGLSADDPWGTAYRVEVTKDSYRIVSAGSDRTFVPESWTKHGQFSDLAEDVVFENGRMTRSHRNFLIAEATKSGKPSAGAALAREAEAQFMARRGEPMTSLLAMRITYDTIEKFAATMKDASGATPPTDAWGTPLRVVSEGTSYRIVSAGADREFNEASWGQPAGTAAGEDIVYTDGAFTRRVDNEAYIKAHPANVKPVPQPADLLLAETPTRFRVGGNVKAPALTRRVEPVYPEEYRKLGVGGGIVIVQAAISATGDVEEVRLLKSVAPEFDLAALEAVRQWKFSPATREGQPVASLYNITINFTLK